MTPSAGMRSPGRTRMIAPTARLSAGTSRVWPSSSTQRRLRHERRSATWMLARALPAATPSSSSPTRNRKTTAAASSVGTDDHRADGGDGHQRLDGERRAGQRRHDGAPRDRNKADQHGGSKGVRCDRRQQLADAIGRDQRHAARDGQQALPAPPPWAGRGAMIVTMSPAASAWRHGLVVMSVSAGRSGHACEPRAAPAARPGDL